MKSEHNLNDTLEINVDAARKAVGSLFDEEIEDLEVEEIGYEDREEEIVTGYKIPDMNRVTELFEQSIEDEDWQTVRRNAAPPPKPALKVNASIPAASRAPARPKKAANIEDREIPPPKARAVKSRYLFLEEDDEFTEFRQRYKDREKRTGLDQPAMPQTRPAQARQEPPRPKQPRPINHGHAIEDDIPRPRKRPVANPENFPQEVYAPAGIPLFVRGIIIALTVMLLMMMAFLIYRINVVSAELDEANERIAGIPAMQEELTRTRIDLYAAQEALELQIAENVQLASGAGNIGYTEPETPYEPYNGVAPDQPAPPVLPGTDRIHTVVAGDNLYRISVQFYGNGSYANIQRIMAANNITDPDTIQVGEQLTIPY